MTKGKHTLIYGGEFALDKGMFAANLYNFGVFTFQSSAPTSTGNALADFVTGQVNTMEQDTPYHTLMSAWHTAVFRPGQLPHHAAIHCEPGTAVGYRYASGGVVESDRGLCSRPAVHRGSFRSARHVIPR